MPWFRTREGWAIVNEPVASAELTNVTDQFGETRGRRTYVLSIETENTTLTFNFNTKSARRRALAAMGVTPPGRPATPSVTVTTEMIDASSQPDPFHCDCPLCRANVGGALFVNGR